MTYLRTAGWLQPGQIQPWVEIGEKIVIKRLYNYFLYRVENLEQLPESAPLIIDFATLVSGSNLAVSSINQSITSLATLQMNGYELGQFRIRMLEDFELQVYEIQSIPRYLNQPSRARISKLGQIHDPHCSNSEIAVYQDEVPFFDAINPSPSRALYTARAAFFGFRYQLSNIGNRTPDGNNIIGYDGYPSVESIPGSFSVVMGEGFAGAGYRRAGD